jgi:hypothetical protein
LLAGLMMEATVEDTALDALVAAVDDRRASGLSVATACRIVGVSTSTYYRRRRSRIVGKAGKALALAALAPTREWPFSTQTPRAPVFWDQAFADELSDSFVRREFGGGGPKARPGRALEALTAGRSAAAAFELRAQRLLQRLSAGPLGAAGPAIVALAAVAAVGLAAAWMVSVAADPAAWLSQPQALAAASH